MNIELLRVSDSIAAIIEDFCKDRGVGGHFYMTELLDWVEVRKGTAIAPDSPGRILRMLRQENKINYVLVSRSESLYKVV